jgi:hypothetical protein
MLERALPSFTSVMGKDLLSSSGTDQISPRRSLDETLQRRVQLRNSTCPDNGLAQSWTIRAQDLRVTLVWREADERDTLAARLEK